VLGVVYSVWALIGTGKVVLLWGAGLLVAGVPVYFWMKRSARNTVQAGS